MFENLFDNVFSVGTGGEKDLVKVFGESVSFGVELFELVFFQEFFTVGSDSGFLTSVWDDTGDGSVGDVVNSDHSHDRLEWFWCGPRHHFDVVLVSENSFSDKWILKVESASVKDVLDEFIFHVLFHRHFELGCIDLF